MRMVKSNSLKKLDITLKTKSKSIAKCICYLLHVYRLFYFTSTFYFECLDDNKKKNDTIKQKISTINMWHHQYQQHFILLKKNSQFQRKVVVNKKYWVNLKSQTNRIKIVQYLDTMVKWSLRSVTGEIR